MGFKKENKRVSLKAVKKPTSNNVITKISVNSLELVNTKNTIYFKRLLYQGAPSLGARRKNASGEFSKNKILVAMDRKKFVVEMYELFFSLPNNATTYSTFELLVDYVRILDSAKVTVDFSEKNVFLYIEKISEKVKKGLYSLTTLHKKKNGLSAILKAKGDIALAKKLPSIKGAKAATIPHKTLTDHDFTRVGKKLMGAYMSYSKYFITSDAPQICPLFDETQLLKDGFSGEAIDDFKRIAKQRVDFGRWENKMVSLAFLITSMWSGANLGPLLTLRRKDVAFKKCDGDSYEFDTVKARALYEQQKLGFGFTKRTKEFIESWLKISYRIDSSRTALLFPFYARNNEIVVGCNPQTLINNAIVPYGFPKVTTSILRKTRSNAVMRAFDDVFVVASANHSSVGVVKSNYINGITDNHERSLAGAFVVQEQIAFGKPKEVAIKEALYKFKDPLSEFEYNQKHSSTLNKTSSGLRCTSPLGKQAEKSLRPFRKFATASGVETCIDFLYCFQCENHAVVAEPDDIWMMISFKDTVIDMINRPAINSKPSERYHKTLNTVIAILDQLKNKYPEAFNEAMILNQKSSHPLYADSDSISDLQEVYK